jgi:hypothetical protein
VAKDVFGIVAFLYETPFLALEIYRLMTILESSPALGDYGETYEGDRDKVQSTAVDWSSQRSPGSW